MPSITANAANLVPVCVYLGEELGRYAFPDHPFGDGRLAAFTTALRTQGLLAQICTRAPQTASSHLLAQFHHKKYIEEVIAAATAGVGKLDCDTPVFPGIYDAAATVVGTAVAAARALMDGECRRAFVPIGGLHHGYRHRSAGFCVFNDCGVVIEILRKEYGLHRILYVDIDAHHGDGVFYAFEDDPELFILDFHEDGKFLYPGTGSRDETGHGPARGTKLNVPLPPASNDTLFLRYWQEAAEPFIAQARPEFIVFQCGADCLTGDPLAHLQLTPEIHRYTAQRLSALADEHCQGRILGLGGGGYALHNLGPAWTGVVEGFLGD